MRVQVREVGGTCSESRCGLSQISAYSLLSAYMYYPATQSDKHMHLLTRVYGTCTCMMCVCTTPAVGVVQHHSPVVTTCGAHKLWRWFWWVVAALLTHPIVAEWTLSTCLEEPGKLLLTDGALSLVSNLLLLVPELRHLLSYTPVVVREEIQL